MPNSTVPAAATGLPADITTRRTALVTLAGLGAAAMSLPTAVKAATPADPVIAELARLYTLAAARSRAADAAADAADRRIVSQTVPEVLFEQPGDRAIFGVLLQAEESTAHFDRRWYGSQIDLARNWRLGNLPGSGWDCACKRLAEIIEAYDAWQGAVEDARIDAGVPAATAEVAAAWEVEKEIRLRIIALRSPDPEALRLKLRVIERCLHSSGTVDEPGNADLAIETALDEGGGPWEDAFAFSIVRDLLDAREMRA